VITVRNPLGSSAPESCQGVEVSGGVRTLYIAGQIGLQQNGTIPDGIEPQTRTVYANMKAVLDAADMGFADVVKTTVFLANPKVRAAFAAIRSEATGAPLGREDGCNQGPRFFRQIRVVPLITDQLQLQNRTFQTSS
jgi:2-iminobutanoate/2-iminopropanoate deaminase